MSDPILIDDLTLAYATQRVLSGLSWRVPAGSITALLGGQRHRQIPHFGGVARLRQRTIG